MIVQVIPAAGITVPTVTGTIQWAAWASEWGVVVELELVVATDVLYGYQVAIDFV